MRWCRACLIMFAFAGLAAGCTGNSEKGSRMNQDKPVPPTAAKTEKTEKK